MTDRKLLEAAAKAAGIDFGDKRSPTGSLALYLAGAGWWDPLTDDSDALRLAVKLEIDLCFGANYVIADMAQEPTVNNANNPCAAVRRAVVRAAAARVPK